MKESGCVCFKALFKKFQGALVFSFIIIGSIKSEASFGQPIPSGASNRESSEQEKEAPFSLYEQVKKDREGVNNHVMRCLNRSCTNIDGNTAFGIHSNEDTDVKVTLKNPMNVGKATQSPDGHSIYSSYIQDGKSFAEAPNNGKPYLSVTFKSETGAMFPGGRIYPGPNVKVANIGPLGEKTLDISQTHAKIGSQLNPFFDYKITELFAHDPASNETVDVEISDIQKGSASARVVNRKPATHK